MKINKRLLQEIAPDGGIRPGLVRDKAKRKELRETRDSARRISRKRLKRILDKDIDYVG